MAHRLPTSNVKIAADLMHEVRLLPLPQGIDSDIKKVAYVLQAGINSLAFLAYEKAKNK